MVARSEIDDQLRDEVVSECSNYGTVKVKHLFIFYLLKGLCNLFNQ